MSSPGITDVNGLINDVANSVTNNNQSPEVQNLVALIISLVDSGIADLNAWIANLVSNSSLQNSSLTLQNHTFTAKILKQKIKDLKSRNIKVPLKTSTNNTTITNDVNSVAVDGVNTVLNDISTNSNNPLITAFISAIKSTIDTMTINLIDPVINNILIRFSSKAGIKLHQKLNIEISMNKRFKSGANGTGSGTSTTDSNVNAVTNDITNTVVNSVIQDVDPTLNAGIVSAITEVVDNITDYLVDAIVGKLKTVKLSKANQTNLNNGNLSNSVIQVTDSLQGQINQTMHNITQNIVARIDHPAKAKIQKLGLIGELKNEITHIGDVVIADLKKAEASIEGLWNKFGMKRPKLNLRITRDSSKPKLKFNLSNVSKLPSKFSLRDKMGAVWSQGDLGSCTAFATLKAYQYLVPNFEGSKLFQYQQELLMDGTGLNDSGSTVSTAFASLRKNGVCSEKTWPYDLNNFTKMPPAIAVNEALLNRDLQDGVLSQNLNDMKMCLADPEHQNPIVLGVILFDNFESEETLSTGIVQMPDLKKNMPIGGHCLCCVSYDDEKQQFGMINSWGPNVMCEGFVYFPYKYILDSRLTSDLHVLYKTTTNVSMKAIKPEIPKGMYKLNQSVNTLRPDSLGKTISPGYKREEEKKIVENKKAPTVPKLHHTNVSRAKMKTKN
jgi:hypothetical protein